MVDQDDEYIMSVLPEKHFLFDKIEQLSAGHENVRPRLLSLKTHCLTSISLNMERFAAAFYTSNNPILQRNIFFLRKKFPDLCLKKLVKKGYLDRRYLEFAVTEFLDEINLEFLVKCPREEIKKMLSSVGHVFTKVSYMLNTIAMGEMPKSDFIIELLPYFPNLKVYHTSFACDDATLKALVFHCVHLEEISISNCLDVTNEGLGHLCRKACNGDGYRNNIRKISISHPHRGCLAKYEGGIKKLLKNLPLLEEFECPGVARALWSIHYKNPLKLQLFYLTSIDCRWSSSDRMRFRNILLPPVVDFLPQVKKITANVYTLGDVGDLGRLSTLEDASLRCCADEEYIKVDHFLENCGRNLQRLKLEYFCFSVNVLIQSCTRLQCLILNGCVFCSGTTADTSIMPQLEMLIISGYILSDENCVRKIACILRACSNLKHLVFYNCDIRQTGHFHFFFLEFCQRSALKHMSFKYCKVDRIFYMAAFQAQNLQTLGITESETCTVEGLRSGQSSVTVFSASEEDDKHLNSSNFLYPAQS